MLAISDLINRCANRLRKTRIIKWSWASAVGKNLIMCSKINFISCNSRPNLDAAMFNEETNKIIIILEYKAVSKFQHFPR